ncbi:MAG: hypothetical protein AAF799_28600 [Myxococcota bacterium]
MRFAWVVLGGACAILSGCFDPDPGGAETDDASDTSAGESATPGGTTLGDTPTDETSSPPAATEGGTGDTGTTDPDTTEGPSGCAGEGLDPSCDEATPYCQDGTCVDCTGLPADACIGFDSATPVCDADAGVCAGCTEHDQCVTGACRFSTGECFAESNRLWVDNTFAGCAAGVGSEESPMCTVEQAVQVINAQIGMDPWAVFVAGSPNPYVGTIDPSNNRPIAVVGPSSGLSAILVGDGNWTIDLWNQSPETYLANLTIEGASDGQAGSASIRCNTGVAYLTDSNLVNSIVGVNINGCSLHMRRSLVSTGGWGVQQSGGELFADETVFENSSGAIESGGSVTLRRSYVRDHWVDGGIHITDGGDLTLVNSMVYNNNYVNRGIMASGGTVDIVGSTVIGNFDCLDTAVGPHSVRSSIVMNHFDVGGMACANATVDDSLVNDGVALGAGNVPVEAADMGSIFVDPNQGMGSDWHVLPGSLPEGVAVHLEGDPRVDIDGDPRPQRPGAADYAGADVP